MEPTWNLPLIYPLWPAIFGEYIEELSKDDEFIQMLIGEYTSQVDPSISVSNAINVLDDMQQLELLKRVELHLNNHEGDIDVLTSTPVDLVEESYGKNILTTFMKCLTALGFKDNTPESKEVPAEFLVFFKFTGVDSSKIESVFKRFKSLASVKIDYTQPKMGLYFGIKCDSQFEYGYYYDELIPIGQFKLNKSSFNSLKALVVCKNSIISSAFSSLYLYGSSTVDSKSWYNLIKSLIFLNLSNFAICSLSMM